MPTIARIFRGVFVGSLTGALLVAVSMALLGMGSFFSMIVGGAFVFLFVAFGLVNTPLLYALHRIGWRDWSAIAFAGGLTTMAAMILSEWVFRGAVGPVSFVIRPVETITFIVVTGVVTGCVGWWAANAQAAK